MITIKQIIQEITGLQTESEWVEYKLNNTDQESIGEYISAMSNTAKLIGRPYAYLIWGIDNATHSKIGTHFSPNNTKIGNEELESWLARLLYPRIDFRFCTEVLDCKAMVMLVIPAANHVPVRFKDTEYIRVGSYKKKLKEFPEKERKLWKLIDMASFELEPSNSNLKSEDILALIDYTKYFELIGMPLPDNREGILNRLKQENIVQQENNDTYHISNLGGILFAKDLTNFPNLNRKKLRIIQYKGYDRTITWREFELNMGYAIGFERAIETINNFLPQNEEINQALRKEVKLFPEIAIRELLANTLIHQDFLKTGMGPMVEIFDKRIEFTNPGIPLIDQLRFIDEPPCSRNETLASFMRRMHICEERGSGIDKVIKVVELYQLPAPEFQVTSQHTKVILYAYRNLSAMDKNDKIRACYQHACLQHISGKEMTNTSLRDRFKIEKINAAIVSRIINDAIAANLIKSTDPTSKSRKHKSYIPFWA